MGGVGSRGVGFQGDGNGEVKLKRKFKKKLCFFLGGRGGVGLGGQGGCEWRSEAFVKIQKKNFEGGGGVGVGGGSGGVGSDQGLGWRRWGGGSGQRVGSGGGVGLGGVRVDGNGELKLL